jgi:hypothetical protein
LLGHFANRFVTIALSVNNLAVKNLHLREYKLFYNNLKEGIKPNYKTKCKSKLDWKKLSFKVSPKRPKCQIVKWQSSFRYVDRLKLNIWALVMQVNLFNMFGITVNDSFSNVEGKVNWRWSQTLLWRHSSVKTMELVGLGLG